MDRLEEAHEPANFLSRVQDLHQGEVARLQGGVAVKRLSTEDGRDGFKVAAASRYRTDPDFYGDLHRTAEDAAREAFRLSARSTDPESIGGATSLSTYGPYTDPATGAEVRIRDWTTDGRAIIGTPGQPTGEKVVNPASLVKRSPVLYESELREGKRTKADRDGDGIPYERGRKGHALDVTPRDAGTAAAMIGNAPSTTHEKAAQSILRSFDGDRKKARKYAKRFNPQALPFLQEVEQVRPGTNFTKIPPQNVKRLEPIIKHYRGMAHPFSTCVRDQIKHGLSEDHANRRCAVVKDLGEGTTKWRGKGKLKESVSALALTESVVADFLAELETEDPDLVEGILALSEEWSDAARRAAYLARIRRLGGGAGVLLDHGVRVTPKGNELHVSSPHSLTEKHPASSPEKVVDAVFRHQAKATRRKPMAWMQASAEEPFWLPPLQEGGSVPDVAKLEEDWSPEARAKALAARKAKHPDWDWGGFKSKLSGMKVGDDLEVPGGFRVHRTPAKFNVARNGLLTARHKTPEDVEQHLNPASRVGKKAHALSAGDQVKVGSSDYLVKKVVPTPKGQAYGNPNGDRVDVHLYSTERKSSTMTRVHRDHVLVQPGAKAAPDGGAGGAAGGIKTHYAALADIRHISGKLPEGFKLKKAAPPDTYDMKRAQNVSGVFAPDGTHLGFVGKVEYGGERVMSGSIQVGTSGKGLRWAAFTAEGRQLKTGSLHYAKNRFDALRSLGRYHPTHGKG